MLSTDTPKRTFKTSVEIGNVTRHIEEMTDTHTADVPWIPSNTFANRLVLVRRELGGMSVKAASARCGLNYATWSTWENGRTQANMPAVVDAIAHGLGVDRDWLMWGEARINPQPLPKDEPPGVPMTHAAA